MVHITDGDIPMKIADLMDMTLREILEEYVSIQSLECGYYYGITTVADAKKIFENYNVDEEYSEGFFVENLVNDELLLDDSKPILTYEKLENIMHNLSITPKEAQSNED